ncbi:hypothetical protein [Amycolatopsis taiwanensis]|uniref:hypothetical protein n=1 Tax=Amycolatopsis taiwanensis TaxID=342230 RepID=UPI0004AD33ED|nr:hypothetical protein [Amycolatopsis taiwanensis]
MPFKSKKLWILGAVAVVVLAGIVTTGGILIADQTEKTGAASAGGGDRPSHRAAPNWPGQYPLAADLNSLCPVLDTASLNDIAPQRNDNADNGRAEQSEKLLLGCTSKLDNLSAHPSFEQIRNVDLIATANVMKPSETANDIATRYQAVSESAKDATDRSSLVSQNRTTDEGALPGVGDEASFTFASSLDRGAGERYIALYTVVVHHGNLVLRLQGTWARKTGPWTVEEVSAPMRDMAISIMDGLHTQR